MIQKPIQPDPIDKLLQKIANEADVEQRYASFLQRCAARIVDTTIVLAIAYTLGWYFIYLIGDTNQLNEDYIIESVKKSLPALALMIWVLIYSPLLESTGGTLGKRLVRIKLVDAASDETPAFRMCMARSWIYMVFIVLAVVPSVLSCLAYFVSDQKQTWHDKLTNMICLKK